MSAEYGNGRLITANYIARTFLLSRETQFNFSSSSVRWIHSVRSIVADCVGLFFLVKWRKQNIVVEL